MDNLYKTHKPYYRYFSLLAIVILGVVSLLGSGGGGDSTPPPPSGPDVIGVLPLQNSNTALVTTEVTARFSKSMAPLTINPSSFLLRLSGSTQISGSIDYYAQYEGHDNVAVFVPTNDLDIGKEYIATLTTEITDTDSEPLSNDYVWSFFIAPSPVPISTNAAGSFGTSGIDISSSSMPNATGEYVVFASTDDLAGPGTNSYSQIYRKNTITRGVELVSISSNNQNIANGNCAAPRISDSGRYIVFSSTANNLDPSITLPSTGISHIYLKDMRDGTISLIDISVNNPNQAANGNNTRPDISGIPITDPQGKHVVFESTATDLVTGYTNNQSDIFYVNAATSGIEIISVDSNGNEAIGHSYRPRVSDDGRRIVFESLANNLVTDDTNTVRDVFLRVRNTTTTSRLSVDSAGAEANGASSNADISADGQYAVFQSNANNLVLGDNNSLSDIFLRNIDTPATSRMSLDASGTEASGSITGSTNPAINTDGSYVAFESDATNLVSSDTNGVKDAFVRHTQTTSKIARVTVDNLGAQGNDPSENAAISADGRYVSFTTPWAFDDVTDTNGNDDIYRAYNAAIPIP